MVEFDLPQQLPGMADHCWKHIDKRMTRRHFLQAICLPLLNTPIAGCTFMTDDKTPISKYGRSFDYLKAPALHAKEVGERMLEVKGALISGVPFKGIWWKNIRFIECDFTGAYEIKLAGISNCLFERCRFAGIFDFGLAQSVRFDKAVVRGDSVLFTSKGSTSVLFENSDFRGLSDNSNDWGAIFMSGEARYVNCYAKWFKLKGEEKLNVESCRFDTAILAQRDTNASPSVTISDTEFIGNTDMVSSHMSSLTMRNCTVGLLDLSQAHVSGDVLLEKVSGEQLELGFYTAGKVVLRNCTVKASGDAKASLNTAVDSLDQFIAENCIFKDKPVAIGPGGALRDDQWSDIPQNKLTRFTNCAMEFLGAAWTESQALRIEQCTISSADFSNSRIGSLQIEASTISQKLDLSNTRIKSHSIKDLEPSKHRQVLLDGSNIKQI
jgi:hypothetical protein